MSPQPVRGKVGLVVCPPTSLKRARETRPSHRYRLFAEYRQHLLPMKIAQRFNAGTSMIGKERVPSGTKERPYETVFPALKRWAIFHGKKKALIEALRKQARLACRGFRGRLWRDGGRRRRAFPKARPERGRRHLRSSWRYRPRRTDRASRVRRRRVRDRLQCGP